MLEAPPEDTIVGLRDRAKSSVGLGRAEIVALTSILPRTAVIGSDRRARSVLFEQALGCLVCCSCRGQRSRHLAAGHSSP